MNQVKQLKPKPHSPTHGQVNPFAHALAEVEKSEDMSVSPQISGLDAFRQALQKSQGTKLEDSIYGNDLDLTSDAYFKQQTELRKQQERAALRKKLHDQIHPTDTRALFDAREKQVKDQIKALKQELKALSQEVTDFNKDVELTLFTKVVDPGEKGSYFITFFQQLRSFILLLKQRVSSARTWLQASQTKRSKQSNKPGMQIKGQGFQKTSTVQNMMHHERSSSYAGA